MPTNYDNFNIWAEFFTWRCIHIPQLLVGVPSVHLKVTKMGVSKPRISSLFGNSKGGAVRGGRGVTEGTGNTDLDLARKKEAPDTGHEQPGLAGRQGVPPGLRNGRCHGQSWDVAIGVGKEVRCPRRRRKAGTPPLGR